MVQKNGLQEKFFPSTISQIMAQAVDYLWSQFLTIFFQSIRFLNCFFPIPKTFLLLLRCLVKKTGCYSTMFFWQKAVIFRFNGIEAI